jgi:hypothetical protein
MEYQLSHPMPGETRQQQELQAKNRFGSTKIAQK